MGESVPSAKEYSASVRMLCMDLPLVAVCRGSDSVFFPPGKSVNCDRECGREVVAVTVHAVHRKSI